MPGTKPSRNAKRKRDRKNAALEKLVHSTASVTNSSQVDEAMKFLQTREGGPPHNADPLDAIDHILFTQMGHKLSRISRKTYLQCLDMARALSRVIEGLDAKSKRESIDQLSRYLKIKQTGALSIRTLVLRAVIDYGTGKNGKPSEEARRLWSRDGRAISFLDAQKVRLGGIVDFQKENGGGADSWSRAAATTRRRSQDADEDEGNDEDEGEDTNARDELAAGTRPLPVVIKRIQSELKDGESAVVLVVKQEASFTATYTKTKGLMTKPPWKDGLWVLIEKKSAQLRKRTKLG